MNTNYKWPLLAWFVGLSRFLKVEHAELFLSIRLSSLHSFSCFQIRLLFKVDIRRRDNFKALSSFGWRIVSHIYSVSLGSLSLPAPPYAVASIKVLP